MKTKKYVEYMVEETKKILAIDSPSGYTAEVADYVMKAYQKLGYEPKLTTKGGVLVALGGKDKKNAVMLEAHIDTLGAMVAQIKSDGRLRVTPIGGMNANNAEAENCRIHTRFGKKVYEGTLQLANASIHVNGDYNDKKRTFDETEIVLDEKVHSREDVEALGIMTGDIVCFDPRTTVTESGYIKSRFLDDKLSVGILLGYARYLKEENVKFSSLKNGNFNSIMNKGSGSGIIFGSSGGVLEATMREVYRILTGRRPSRRLLNFKEIRGLSNIKEANIKIKGINIRVASINGTGDARKVIDKLKNNEVYYDFIEVMACEGGCIAGGGQPRVYPNTPNLKLARMKGLYDIDKKMKIRCASDNVDIIDIYKSFLGERGSDTCKKYLHRGYNVENK